MLNARNFFMCLLLTGALLLLVAWWVPVNWFNTSPYSTVSLLAGLQPRALLGTVVDLLNLGPAGYTWLKLLFQFAWLLLVVCQIERLASDPVPMRPALIAGLSAIFAFSTVTYINFPAGFVDVASYAFMAAAILLMDSRHWKADLPTGALLNLLVMLAVLAHEKALFEIAILVLWCVWKTGLRNTAILFAPGLLLTAVYLYSVSSQATLGLPIEEYANILGSGLASGLGYLFSPSFNIWGILAGGGAFWILYGLFAWRFVAAGENKWRRGTLSALLVLLCLAPLLVAFDTNRLVALIWMPVLLMLTEINPGQIFDTGMRRAGLGLLCAMQLLNPPMLMYGSGIVPFNCYSMNLAQLLPFAANGTKVDQGPLDIYVHNRPMTRHLMRVCYPELAT